MARKPKTAISYIVAETPQSKGSQRSAIARYADEHGLTVAEEFEDDPTTENRRGLGAAMIAIRDGVATCVLVAKAECLDNTQLGQQVTATLLGLRGAKVVDCSTGEDLTEPDDRDARLIREATALAMRLHRQATVGRMHAGLKTGPKRGRKTYGTYPQETPVVDLILELRKEKGWGTRRIANELNRRGIVNRVGGQWVPNAIQRIIDRHE
jgi:site-specific DNA recombinase